MTITQAGLGLWAVNQAKQIAEDEKKRLDGEKSAAGNTGSSSEDKS